MAATAHAVHNIEVPSTDDMDLHSDNGIDFGDGDIDLDLELAPAAPRQDDDMSIQDAASVNGQDDHTVPTEQDDFMADNDDLIEEDLELPDDNGLILPDQHDMVDATSQQGGSPALVDEDLVDYSDDEGHEPEAHDIVAHEEDVPNVPEAEVDANIGTVAEITEETLEPSAIGEDKNIDDETSHYADDLQHEKIDHQNEEKQQVSGEPPSVEKDDEEEYRSDEEDGGVVLQDTEGLGEQAHDEDAEYEQHALDHQDGEETTVDEHEKHGSAKLPTVTVNYAGNELWLFKDHDPDNSGDWLLEDMSLAKSTMSDLFHACRSSLGDDVSHEHEIGFRFDHLHNLELYEDNTACVAVSLERLVELYHTLQAQDDNHEPESFYISLLFRPRFATLLSDIAKYAEQESGYSALNTAVVAGDTHFTNVFSNASTDEPTEWGNEESEDDNESHSHDASPEVDEPLDEEHSETETHEHDPEEDDSQGKKYHVDDQAETYDAEWNSQHEQSAPGSTVTNSPADQQFPQTEATADENQDVDDTEPQHPEKDGDLIEYGDEEGAGNNSQNDLGPASNQSQSSSTVQGDEFGFTQEEPVSVEGLDAEAQLNEHFNFTTGDVGADEPSYQDEQAQDDDNTAQSYQDYVEDFDGNDPFQDLQQEGAEDPAVSDHFNNDANQDYADVQYHELDQHLEGDFTLATEFDDAEHAEPLPEDFTGTHDLLDLDNIPEWNDEIDPPSHSLEHEISQNDHFDTNNDVEGGAAEAIAPASSSAADPASASSGDAKEMSPQGQKRSIDEAGHGEEDALESTDAKRARV